MAGRAVQASAEKLLAGAWGGTVALRPGDPEGLSQRPYLQRFEVASAPRGSPATVVVKQAPQRGEERYDPQSRNWVTTRFFNEWASLRFLTEVCSDPPAPRFYAGDLERGELVMEDLGTGQRLDHALLGSDPALATRTLSALFETVGRMHAETAGQRRRFEAILDELSARRHPTARGRRTRLLRETKAVLQRMRVTPTRGFYKELEAIAREREAPGSFDVLIHGDPCPDNCHWVDDQVRLLDFEHGRFDDAFGDGCCPRIHFPTCWCVSRLPEEASRQALEAYRAELIAGIGAAADDDVFDQRMTAACVRWAWQTFGGWHAKSLERDDDWGLVSVRQRVLFRFGLVVEMLAGNGLYPAVAETTQQSLRQLSRRWKEIAPMPLYPAFAAGS